jgi:hypothetical protein
LPVVGVQVNCTSHDGHSQGRHSPSAGQAQVQGEQPPETQGISTESHVNPVGQSASAAQLPSQGAATQNPWKAQAVASGQSESGAQAGTLQGAAMQTWSLAQSPSNTHGVSAPRAGTARNNRAASVIVNFMEASSPLASGLRSRTIVRSFRDIDDRGGIRT